MKLLMHMAIFLLLSLPLAAQETPESVARLADHTRALTTTPHRLSGTAEYSQAADYVHGQLRELLPAQFVLEQPYATVQTTLERCDLTTEAGDILPLQPMRPNGIMPAYTPPEGISGPLLYAGNGTLAAYGNRAPKGAIVVLDYNNDEGWLTAFRLGARAVIILADPQAESRHAQHTIANVNLPRFYFEGTRQQLPLNETVTITSHITWQPTQGRNLYAFFPGTQPTVLLPQQETLIIAANLDTFGSVPRRSPGAREAANVGAMLELARYLKANPPRRNVLLAFLDGQARAHVGASIFYRAIDAGESKISIDARGATLTSERDFLQALRDQLQSPTPLAPDAPMFREIRRRLTPMAAQHVFALTHELTLRRIALQNAPEETPEAEQMINEITRLDIEKRRWNSVRRAIGKISFTPEEIFEMLRERSATTILTQADALKLQADKQLEQQQLRADLQREADAVHHNLQTAMQEVIQAVMARLTELSLELATLDADTRLAGWVSGHHFPLHVSLMLGDSTPSWGAIVGGDSMLKSPRDMAGLYQRVLAAIRASADQVAGQPLEHFLRASVDGSLGQTRALWAAPYLMHSGDVAGRLQIYNLCFGTVQETLPRAGTPADTLENLDLARLSAQADEVIRLVGALSASDELSQRYGIERDARYVFPDYSNGRFHGASVMAKSRGSSMPNTPVPNAILRLDKVRAPGPGYPYVYERVKPYGFDDFQVIASNQEGGYSYGPVTRHVHTFDAIAVAFAPDGTPFYGSVADTRRRSHERINMVVCRTGGVVMPLQLSPGVARVMGGDTNSAINDNAGLTQTIDGVIFWFSEESIDRIKIFQLNATVALVNGSAELDAVTAGSDADIAEHAREGVGLGMPQTPHWEFPVTSARAATDLWRLNEARLAVLRKRGVSSSSLEELHGRAEDLLLAGAAAESIHGKEASAGASFLTQRTVYGQVQQTLDDLVKAVLVLLALSVPFAFAAERLLIGSPTIYKQLGWFVAMFMVPFVILYLSHPAFAISKTPVVIFLGFTIIILSSLVIFIIMRKFEVELKVIQGMESTVHAADVSRFGTIIAAMSMGISSMRRRPLRTALTAVTILLLTFTILCFASFGQHLGIIKLFLGPNPGYAAVTIRQVSWQPLPQPLTETIEGRWGTTVQIAPRYWISPRASTDALPMVTTSDARRPVLLRGLLGISAGELTQRPDLARVLQSPAELDGLPRIWLTSAVAGRLNVEVGAKLVISGQHVRLAAIIDPIQLSTLKDLDGSDIVPVDFTEVTSAQQGGGGEEVQVMSDQNWATLPVDSVAIVDAETALRAGARLHAIHLYTAETSVASEIAEDLARMLPLPISATRSEGVFRHVLGAQMQASGARDLIFPIVLGGLVIFGTMLGSVADREKEIYTFSALGLAPQHVAGLFFAEALVYSVLGGLGGYLVAQGSLSALGVLADYGLVRVPEMNYSSTNAIITILLVMATVLISAIYPAIKASRSANPGVMRHWKLPAPHGDVFDIVFPFTVSGYDITGVVSFLKEHFDTFSDAGIGRFISRQAHLVKDDGQVGVHTHLALAPFDLGVTQDFELTSAPSEIAGIDEITIRLVRRSGQPKDWARLNKALLEDLRRQFLIWRSLPAETMELYRQRTLTAFGESHDPAAPSPANVKPETD